MDPHGTYVITATATAHKGRAGGCKHKAEGNTSEDTGSYQSCKLKHDEREDGVRGTRWPQARPAPARHDPLSPPSSFPLPVRINSPGDCYPTVLRTTIVSWQKRGKALNYSERIGDLDHDRMVLRIGVPNSLISVTCTIAVIRDSASSQAFLSWTTRL